MNTRASRTGQIYEIHGDNRSGKGVIEALMAWSAFVEGDPIYCNCPRDPATGDYDHILNFPHQDYNPATAFYQNWHDVTAITDEGEIYMDSAFRTKAVRNVYLFGYQVRKRGIRWIYSTVRLKNIELRVRLNPDFAIETKRYPKDAQKPLRAVKLIVTGRYSRHDRIMWLQNKRLRDGNRLFEDYIFRLYNHDVMVTPSVESAISPGIEPKA
jgi:hypothetical protein